MKNWVIAVVIILSLGIISLGYFSIRQSTDLNTVKKQIVTLNSSLSSLNETFTTLSEVTPSPAVQTTSTTVNTMVNLVPQIEPVIVRIDVNGVGFKAAGSGIIIRKDGYIITNHHVINSAESITATLKNGQKYPATVDSSDADIDLAIIKLTGGPSNLPTVVLGSITDAVIGVNVVAGGFPLGNELPGPASFTRGIVSAIRNIDGQKFVQTDVEINPGSSGGGLFILNANLIGITSGAVLPPGEDVEGLGLAIPIDTIQTYIQNNLK